MLTKNNSKAFSLSYSLLFPALSQHTNNMQLITTVLLEN